MASVSLLREKGGPVPPEWPAVTASAETGGQGMVGLVRTALLTLDAGRDARAAALSILDGWLGELGRPHVWTTLGHTVLLAHLAADHRLAQFCAPLLAQFEPFGDRIAVIGQVGVGGPVALATARLHALAGDRRQARADLDRAADIARRTDAAPTLVRCNLLAAELIDSERQRRAAASAVAAEARRSGMSGVEAAARRLV